MPLNSRSALTPPYLFVYGTLKHGFVAHDILAGSERVETPEHFSIPGVMIHLGHYPGMIPNSSDSKNCRVFGEVYKVSQDILAKTDHYEGAPHHYRRLLVPSEVGYVYVYQLNGSRQLTNISICVGQGRWSGPSNTMTYEQLISYFNGYAKATIPAEQTDLSNIGQVSTKVILLPSKVEFQPEPEVIEIPEICITRPTLMDAP